MNINFTILISSISAIAAISAAIITYKNYKRQKTFDNENHFFKYKIEQYQEIISNAYDLLNTYTESLQLADKYKGPLLYPDSEWDKVIKAIENKTEEFRITLRRYSLFIPQEILGKLSEFYENLFEKPEEEIKIKTLTEAINPLEEKLEEVLNLMRKDVGIDILNIRLNKRIK